MKISDINISEEKWNEKVDKLVDKLIFKLKPDITKESLKNLCEESIIKIVRVEVNEVLAGMFFYRVDTTYSGIKQLVILYSVSDFKSSFPFHHVASFCYDQVKSHVIGEGDIRIHSESRAVDKFLEANGYQYSETVYVKRG